jgi:hypothetical protein
MTSMPAAPGRGLLANELLKLTQNERDDEEEEIAPPEGKLHPFNLGQSERFGWPRELSRTANRHARSGDIVGIANGQGIGIRQGLTREQLLSETYCIESNGGFKQ